MGFKNTGVITADIKNNKEIMNTGNIICLCLIEKNRLIKRKAIPIVMPKFFKLFLSKFSLFILNSSIYYT